MARAWWRGLIAVACLLLVGCGGKTPAATIDAEQQTIASWAATAQVAGDAWARGAVPTAYTRETLRTAREEWQKSGKALREVQPAGDEATGRAGELLDAIGRLDATVGQILDAVARDDRAALGPPLARLADLAGAVAPAR